ncbi:hypothetical protein B0H11DRAFT_1965928 [Mycena galericulata]|nr:hypothetical protein B0H11DRAFT_1965928 [Mycena galericulata]
MSDLLFHGHRDQCTHTDAWDASCRNVMILSQILSTLEQHPSRHHYSPLPRRTNATNTTSKPSRTVERLLTYFLNVLHHYPPKTKQLGAQVFAATVVGNEVYILEEDDSVSELQGLALTQNARTEVNSTDDISGVLETAAIANSGAVDYAHIYYVAEVQKPRRTVQQAVEDSASSQTLEAHVGDVVAALGGEIVEDAEDLIIIRSLSWIRGRLNDNRFFRPIHTEELAGQHPLNYILSALRPPTGLPDISFEVDESALETWDVTSAHEDNCIVTSTPEGVFRRLEQKVSDVVSAFKHYEEKATSGEGRGPGFMYVVTALVQLDIVSRNPVFERQDLFASSEISPRAEGLIRRLIADADDDDAPVFLLGVRVLYAIRRITQPIRSMRLLRQTRLPKLFATGKLKIYTIRQAAPLPQILINDIVQFREAFKVNEKEQYPLDRLIVRAFFSKASLKSLNVKEAGRNNSDDLAFLPQILQELENLADRDFQPWSDDETSPSTSDSSIATSSSGRGSVLSGASHGSNSSDLVSPHLPMDKDRQDGPIAEEQVWSSVPHVQESSSASSNDAVGAGMFLSVCTALKQARIPVKCAAVRHAECLLMIALRGDNEKQDQVFATTKRSCFCCDVVRDALGHHMLPSHGMVLPWVPPCGLSLEELGCVEKALEAKLRDAVKVRGAIDATGSASDTSSIKATKKPTSELDAHEK